MKTLLEKYKKASIDEVLQEIAKVAIARELSVEELAKVKTQFDEKNEVSEETLASLIKSSIVKEEVKPDKASEELKAQVETLTKELAQLKEELTKANAKVKTYEDKEAEQAKIALDAKVKARKDELKEFAKDMKDEDVLDDAKFEVAKLKKENAELKAKKDAIDLTVGSLDKETIVKETAKRQKVDEYAGFGKK